MSEPYLSIVIPSFNEKKNLNRGVLDDVYTYLESQNFKWEIILTDDGSTDGTLEDLVAFAQSHPHVKVLNNPHRGKGPTVAAGMLTARGALRLFTDFDQATPITEIEKLFPFILKHYDVVIGSREIEGAKREHEPFHRHLMGKVFNIAVQLITIRGIHDTQCGFKLFTKRAAMTLFPGLRIYGTRKVRSDAFTGAFDVELLYLAKKKHMKIAEVPVFWKYAKTQRVDPVKDSTRMFIDLLRIRLADLFGLYTRS